MMGFPSFRWNLLLFVALASVACPWNGAHALFPPPTEGAGILVVDDFSSATSTSVWFWNAEHVFVHRVGTTRTWEITAPWGGAIANVRGIIASDDASAGHPTGTNVWIWTDDEVYAHQAGTLTTQRIIAAGGGSIANVRGMLESDDFSGGNPTFRNVWMWTDEHVYAHVIGTLTAQEITDPAGGPIADVRGMIESDDRTGMNPTSRNVWMWNATSVYAHVVGTTWVTNITDPMGMDIPDVQGMISSMDNSSPTGSNIWIWNLGHVYAHDVATVTTSEISDPGGGPVVGVRGMIATDDYGPGNPTDSNVWMWHDEKVLVHNIGTTSTLEITEPGGGSITDARGMLESEDMSGFNPTCRNTWMWNGEQVFVHNVGTTSTLEITEPGGGSIPDTRGMMVSRDETSATRTNVWIWTDTEVYAHAISTTTTIRIRTGGGGSLPDIRGMLASDDADILNPTGNNVWMWSDSRVYVHLIGGPTVGEITDPGGGALVDVWALVASDDMSGLNPTRTNVWIRNGGEIYAHIIGTMTADRITDPDFNPIGSPPYDPPNYAVAVVKNISYMNGGNGLDQAISPFSVAQVGWGLHGSVYVPSPPPATEPGLATVIGNGEGLITIRYSTGSDIINENAAVLLTTPDLMPTEVGMESPPAAFQLGPLSPNPFTGAVGIRYTVPADGGYVSIRVYDVAGRRVSTLVNEMRDAGPQSVEWNGRDAGGNLVGAGVYFMRMEVGGVVQSRKVAVLR